MRKLALALTLALTTTAANAWTHLTLPEASPTIGSMAVFTSAANPTTLQGLTLNCLSTQGAWLKLTTPQEEGYQVPALDDYPAIIKIVVESAEGSQTFISDQLDFWGKDGKRTLEDLTSAFNEALIIRVITDDSREFKIRPRGADKIDSKLCKAGFPPMVDSETKRVKLNY